MDVRGMRPLRSWWALPAAALGLLAGLCLCLSVPALAEDDLRSRATVIIKEKGCSVCHTVPGIPEAVGKVGPNLGTLMKKRRFAGDKLANTPENLRIWLRNPKDVKVTMMPNMHLSEDEITVLIEFFKTL